MAATSLLLRRTRVCEFRRVDDKQGIVLWTCFGSWKRQKSTDLEVVHGGRVKTWRSTTASGAPTDNNGRDRDVRGGTLGKVLNRCLAGLFLPGLITAEAGGGVWFGYGMGLRVIRSLAVQSLLDSVGVSSPGSDLGGVGLTILNQWPSFCQSMAFMVIGVEPSEGTDQIRTPSVVEELIQTPVGSLMADRIPSWLWGGFWASMTGPAAWMNRAYNQKIEEEDDVEDPVSASSAKA